MRRATLVLFGADLTGNAGMNQAGECEPACWRACAPDCAAGIRNGDTGVVCLQLRIYAQNRPGLGLTGR